MGNKALKSICIRDDSIRYEDMAEILQTPMEKPSRTILKPILATKPQQKTSEETLVDFNNALREIRWDGDEDTEQMFLVANECCAELEDKSTRNVARCKPNPQKLSAKLKHAWRRFLKKPSQEKLDECEAVFADLQVVYKSKTIRAKSCDTMDSDSETASEDSSIVDPIDDRMADLSDCSDDEYFDCELDDSDANDDDEDWRDNVYSDSEFDGTCAFYDSVADYDGHDYMVATTCFLEKPKLKVCQYLCDCGECPWYSVIEKQLATSRYWMSRRAKRSVCRVLQAYTTYNEHIGFRTSMIRIAEECLEECGGNEDQAFAAFIEMTETYDTI